MPEIKNCSIIVAITSQHYWGKGATVEHAIAQCRKAGASGSQDVLLYAYHGPADKLAEVCVNGMGDVEYHKELVSVRVGMVTLNINKQPKPRE